MIRGQIKGSKFVFDDGEITSSDKELAESLKEMFDLLLADYELQDGLPELIFLGKLKKYGATNLKYEPTDEEYDFIQDEAEESITGDMALDEEEPKAWITMHGNHVPLFEGQSKEEAVKRFLDRAKGNGSKTTEKKENNHEGNGKEEREKERIERREHLVRKIQERMDSSGHDAFVSKPYRGGSENGLGDGLVKEEIEINDDLKKYFDEADLRYAKMYRLDNSPESASLFQKKISEAKEKIGEKASSVYVYPTEDYQKMKMFLTKDGTAGIAVKEDGDIVSVFSTEKGMATYMLQLAINNGGEKLDCFDTYLTKIYKSNGFREYKRDAWNEEYKPEGWDKEYYKQFNNGEPDVVYMKIDKKDASKYKKDSKESFSDYASKYDEKDVNTEKVLDGLESYVSEAGFTHSKEDMKKAIADVEKKIAAGEETINKYRVSGRRNEAVYTPEREKVHEDIIESLLKDKQPSKNPTFILLGGRGGSGKSKFNGEVYDKKDFVVLDADKIKEMLPEYEGWNAAHLHEESADVLEKALAYAKKQKLNVVLDATMNGLNSTQRRLNLFKDSGYRTEMHYMFLPRQKAARRAITRFVDKPDGRYVPIDRILDMTDNEKNFEALKGSVDAYSFSNNDVPFGKMPVLVERKGDFSFKGGKKWM